MKTFSPLGLIIEPTGNVRRHNLTIEQDIVWGKEDKKEGRPAWLRPLKMFRGKRRAFVLLTTNTLAPIANPGEDTTQIDRARLSKVMRQQYDKTMGLHKPLDIAGVQMYVMWAIIILTLGLVILALITGGTSFISEKIRGEDVVARFSHVNTWRV